VQVDCAEGVCEPHTPAFCAGAGVCSTGLPPGHEISLYESRTSALEDGERRLREKLY
jgi:hypothetical protein